MKYRNANYIGRFNPFHLGHLKSVKKALELADMVTIHVGSTGVPATSKNPFSFFERKCIMIESMVEAGIDMSKIRILSQRDYRYNEELWIAEVLKNGTLEGNNCIIGHSKDESSYYLSHFKEWDYFEMKNIDGINATDIRDRMYHVMKSPKSEGEWSKFNSYSLKVMGDKASSMLRLFMYEKEVNVMAALEDWWAIKEYKKSWEAAPFPPVFVTGDAVCVQGPYVLLIQRGDNPGKGLWALPGGFLDQNETVKECIIRELVEETGIKVPTKVLYGSMSEPQMFDNPGRSLRGRSITHASLIRLDNTNELPKVKGGDDAAKAWWHSIADLPREKMFEDHYDILANLLKLS